MDTATSYTTRSLNHLGIIAGICEKIKLVENIDRCFPDQNEKRSLSVGEASKALILNALGFVSRPLYLTPEFFRNKPVELLFRDGLTPDDFNDDSLGRALDILFEGGLTELFAYVASKALLTYGISHKGKHLDTTSLSFQGKYLDPSDSSTGESLPKEEVSPDNYDPKPILITYGHSKDKRPDLKQAVVSLITEHQSSIPVWLQVLDGNTSDKTHFPKAIENYIEQVGLSEETYFKMDSAFYGEKNIQENADVGWISRVPETIKEAKRVIEETLQEEMQAIEGEEGYKIKTVESHYGKVKQRWIVVYSEKAYDREEKAFEKKRKTAQDSAERELKKIGKQEFACESDALQAVKKVEKKWKYHRAEVEIKEVERYKKAGRPKEGEKATKLSFIVEGKVVEEEETVKKERRNFGKFILATNLAEEKKSAKEVLIEYKGQGTSVERGFRFLKDPMFFASGIFLKKPSRIMALIMIMGLSLLVYSLAERELRQKLVEQKQTLPDQRGYKTQRITMRRVFQIFEGIDELSIHGPEGSKRVILNLTDVQRQILSLFGTEVQQYYFLSS